MNADIVGSREALESLLTNLPGNIVRRVLHADGRFTYAFLSAGLRDTFDIEPTEITAQSDVSFEWIHPDDRASFRAALLASAATLSPIDLENRVTGQDGTIRWVRSIATTRRLENGDVVWDGIAIDVTDKRTAEEEMRAALRRAEEADRAKTRFLAAASHDLRQPLQAMRFQLARLNADPDGAARETALAQLEATVDSMESLMSSLLDISKLDAGMVSPSLERVSLRALMDGLVRDASPAAEAAAVSIRIEASSGDVLSDPALLSIVCRNLIQNALKFTPAGGSVRLRARGGGRPRIIVLDDGVGIERSRHRQIFEPFVQVGNVARDRSLGLGLGLAIVERVARLIDARISVRSTPGRGSAFIVWLDATAPPPPAARPLGTRVEPAPTDLTGRRVWILENDMVVRESLRALLLQWGVDASAVAQATELDALADASDAPPDVVIADFRLPGDRNGGAAIQDLRRRFGATVPGVILTGDTAPDRILEAQSMNCLVLHKPVKPGRLRSALSACIDASATTDTAEAAT